MQILSRGKFFGDVRCKMNCYGLYLIEKFHKPQIKLPKHKHDNSYYCYAVQGSWTEILEKEARQCSKGALIYHKEQEVHCTYFNRHGARTFNIEITNEFKSLFDIKLLPPSFTSWDHHYNEPISRIYQYFLKRDISKNLIEEILLPVLLDSPSKNTIPQNFLCIKQRLDSEEDEKISLNNLAKEFHLHPVHISRGFKHHFGETITGYQNKKRIASLIQYLKNPSYTIKEIALLNDYYDISHLSKFVKKEFRKPIDVLRKELRQLKT